MFKALKRFGIGDSFITWVKMLYLCPKSSVLTNGDKSGPVELQRRVRQGDPLSPLLFNVALEPLAIEIRSHRGIEGIKIGEMESRVGLYADDTLLYLSDPEVSVPPLLDFINSFGTLSGYTINWGKSEFMPLSDSLDPRFLDISSHLFWLRPQLHKFWCDVFQWLSLVYKLDITPDPELALFGCSENALRYSPEIQQALMLGMVAALMLGENYSPGLEIPRSPLLSKMAQRNDWDYPDGKDTLPQL